MFNIFKQLQITQMKYMDLQYQKLILHGYLLDLCHIISYMISQYLTIL